MSQLTKAEMEIEIDDLCRALKLFWHPPTNLYVDYTAERALKVINQLQHELTASEEHLRMLYNVEIENVLLLDDKAYLIKQEEKLLAENKRLAAQINGPPPQKQILTSLQERENICWEASKMFLDNRDAHGLHDMGVEIQALQRAQAEVKKL